MSAQHDRALDALLRRGRLRELAPRIGLDFSSNDYLGLAESADLRDAALAAIARGVSIGAGGSRLLRGNTEEHEALETEAARFFGAESALFFGSGFAANSALYATLPQRGDLILYDELVHASVFDGLRLSKATAMSFPHNDCQACEGAIRTWRKDGGTGTVWIGVETLYSMDGDRAPLDALDGIASRHGAMLFLDEAHATGVFGLDGRGLGADLEGKPNIISLHTCGKALGVMGALVLGPRALRDFLVNRARAFIYATAPSPLIVAIVRAALVLCRDRPEHRKTLQARIAFASEAFGNKLGIVPSGSQIQPIIVGSDARAVALAEALQRRGFDIRAIRPPTVPEGTARLRLTLTLNTNEADTLALVDALAEETMRLKT